MPKTLLDFFSEIPFDSILDVAGWASILSHAVALFLGACAIVLTAMGVVRVLFRMSRALSKNKIAVFANVNEFDDIQQVLVDSGLFKKKNIHHINKGRVMAAASMDLFVLHWPSFNEKIDDVLSIKKDAVGLVVYAPREDGDVNKADRKKLNRHRNVSLVNFRGRLLQDVFISTITTKRVKDSGAGQQMARDLSNKEAVDNTLERLVELERRGLGAEESEAFLAFLKVHVKALPFIEQHDRGGIRFAKKEPAYVLTTKTANSLIECLKQSLLETAKTRAGEHGIDFTGKEFVQFGAPNAGDIDAVISNLYQTFDEKDLYPSIESKAANLLYLLVKDHCFVDGNKRIAAFLFVWFLDMNDMLYFDQGESVISYPTLYKLTITIAESDPKHKNLLVDLVSEIISFSDEVLPDSSLDRPLASKGSK